MLLNLAVRQAASRIGRVGAFGNAVAKRGRFKTPLAAFRERRHVYCRTQRLHVGGVAWMRILIA